MNNEQIIYLAAYCLAFIVGIIITRAVFSIPEFLKLQRAKVLLLAEIALSNSVKKEIIEKVLSHNEIDHRPQTNEEIREDIEAAKERRKS